MTPYSTRLQSNIIEIKPHALAWGWKKFCVSIAIAYGTATVFMETRGAPFSPRQQWQNTTRLHKTRALIKLDESGKLYQQWFQETLQNYFTIIESYFHRLVERRCCSEESVRHRREPRMFDKGQAFVCKHRVCVVSRDKPLRGRARQTVAGGRKNVFVERICLLVPIGYRPPSPPAVECGWKPDRISLPCCEQQYLSWRALSNKALLDFRACLHTTTARLIRGLSCCTVHSNYEMGGNQMKS